MILNPNEAKEDGKPEQISVKVEEDEKMPLAANTKQGESVPATVASVDKTGLSQVQAIPGGPAASVPILPETVSTSPAYQPSVALTALFTQVVPTQGREGTPSATPQKELREALEAFPIQTKEEFINPTINEGYHEKILTLLKITNNKTLNGIYFKTVPQISKNALLLLDMTLAQSVTTFFTT